MKESMTWLQEQLNSYVFSSPLEQGQEDPIKTAIADELAQAAKDSFLRQFVYKRQEGNKLRVSSLGKPAVLQALSLLGHEKISEPSTKMRHIFFTGDVFEAYVTAYMKLCGWQVTDAQLEVDFEGVKGHIDGIVTLPSGERAILEFKTMSQHYFSKFVAAPNDDRGYFTQASIYSHCLGLPIYWVCINKGTHEVVVLEANLEEHDYYINRAKRIIPLLMTLDKLDDVVNKFQAPPVQEELYRGKPTGNWLVPESMKYSAFKAAFYDIERAKSKGGSYKDYVTGYKSRENARAILQEMTVSVDEEIELLLEEETV